MTSTHKHPMVRALLALLAVAFAGLAFTAATNAATAQGPDDGARSSDRHAGQRLVIRGEDTVVDGGPCPAGVCELQLTDGSFRGTPVGAGGYSGTIKLHVAETFANGEGGVCAPIDGKLVLGAGTPDRLVLALAGDSCQDGAGDPTTTSFTGIVRFTVKHGTGIYAHASGSGAGSFSEDAADREHMTLIGHISR